MSSECSGCGARVADGATSCGACGTVLEPVNGSGGRPVRKRLSIPFATVVALGFAGALMLGSGRAAIGHPTSDSRAVAAAINGNPVHISVPVIALLQRHPPISKRQEGER